MVSKLYDPPNDERFEKREPTDKTSPPKRSFFGGQWPCFSLSIWTRDSVLWKLCWHSSPLLLPLSSWVRLPRELLWWLIGFNHITRLQKSGQRMKVQGNTTPWNPHANLNIYTWSNANNAVHLRATSPATETANNFHCRQNQRWLLDELNRFAAPELCQNGEFLRSNKSPNEILEPTAPCKTFSKCSDWMMLPVYISVYQLNHTRGP